MYEIKMFLITSSHYDLHASRIILTAVPSEYHRCRALGTRLFRTQIQDMYILHHGSKFGAIF